MKRGGEKKEGDYSCYTVVVVVQHHIEEVQVQFLVLKLVPTYTSLCFLPLFPLLSVEDS
jgi:hypothetical protein